ncbi:hypothetical protein [Deinococcus maricopensis]|uniref:Uncharacterized protein n=1 Tax=Deinococcus maricopensis (strain DSM 21211 / LMG 22137 / NRRL B-23946 / LB-34) TaxID=709986 RepID=E8U5P7_DEIML|nr:hypothetical protein [Deinococcus maricopensis]ADV66386.1 hypothetical protein Deima_0730 [Deinococcus maricopensis DSM 21211]
MTNRRARPWYTLPFLLGVVLILAGLFMGSDLRAYDNDRLLGMPIEVVPRIFGTLAETLEDGFGVTRAQWTSSYGPLGNGHVGFSVHVRTPKPLNIKDAAVQARLERVFAGYFAVPHGR